MRPTYAALAALLLAAPSFADDEAASLPGLEATPAAQAAAAAKEAPAPKAEPAAPKAEPAAEKPKAAAKAPEPAKAAAFKPAGAAAPYASVVDGYVEARGQFEEWLRDASSQAKELAEREASLKKDIEAKEAEITQLKFDGSKDAKKQVKQLTQDTKALWKDLKRIDGEKNALRRSLSKSAAAKVRELAASVNQRLAEAQEAP
ncbi:MAG: hypothetical protein HY554_15865 [Elusimicrobia bacterium]|nr:hypothetical protein [Elusimicrobiota bacterium]